MKKLTIEFYNADNGRMELREFAPAEVDDLMKYGILDADELGYYMDDAEAFEKAMDTISKTPRPMSFGELVSVYLENAKSDIQIRA